MTTDKAELLKAATGRRYAEVKVPSYGNCRIQSLTERERAQIEYAMTFADDSKAVAHTLKARLIVMCMVDSAGLRIWSDAEIDVVADLDSRFTAAMVDAIEEHCGISKADVEELEKNSDETATDKQP